MDLVKDLEGEDIYRYETPRDIVLSSISGKVTGWPLIARCYGVLTVQEVCHLRAEYRLVADSENTIGNQRGRCAQSQRNDLGLG